MKTFDLVLDNSDCEVRVVESLTDTEEFHSWVTANPILAVDTETTGLDIYAPGFECTMVQFGNATVSYVLDPATHEEHIIDALDSLKGAIFHNAAFDLLVLNQCLNYPVESFKDRFQDTKILAHLLDPRNEAEGGTGHSLKRLAAVWVSAEAPDSQQELKERFRELKFSVAEGWGKIDRHDDVLQKYAGVDTLITFRLFDVLSALCKKEGFISLVDFELSLALVCAKIQRRGLLLDEDYTSQLSTKLVEEAEHFKNVAARYGVVSVNSGSQVSAALLASGETLTEKTAGGGVKVDKAVLLPLADLSMQWTRVGAREPNVLADAVLRGKRATKWKTTYADAFSQLSDSDHRLHPFISPLAARTARMSVSRPPLQQLPSSDATIRRCFIADPGMSLFAIDYSQIEVRVLAGMCGDKALSDAIKSGVDLHSFTAENLYGPDFTDKQRKIAKGLAFGSIYGGGVATLSRQTGAPIEDVTVAVAAYARLYPGIGRFARGLIEGAKRGHRSVKTPTGRVLPLDADRLYAATNFIIQSTARDIFAQALVNIDEAGLSKYVLLPIHDELLCQAPIDEVDQVMAEMQVIFEKFDFQGVPLVSDGTIIGSKWSNAYEDEGEGK